MSDPIEVHFYIYRSTSYHLYCFRLHAALYLYAALLVDALTLACLYILAGVAAGAVKE